MKITVEITLPDSGDDPLHQMPELHIKGGNYTYVARFSALNILMDWIESRLREIVEKIEDENSY